MNDPAPKSPARDAAEMLLATEGAAFAAIVVGPNGRAIIKGNLARPVLVGLLADAIKIVTNDLASRPEPARPLVERVAAVPGNAPLRVLHR